MATSPLFGVPYNEFRGSPREHFENDNSTAQRMVQCAWADRVRLKTEILGFPVLNIGSAGGAPAWISRVLPWYHPDYAGPIKNGLISPYQEPGAHRAVEEDAFVYFSDAQLDCTLPREDCLIYARDRHAVDWDLMPGDGVGRVDDQLIHAEGHEIARVRRYLHRVYIGERRAVVCGQAALEGTASAA